VIDKPLKKKEISKLINAAFRRCGLKETVIFRRQADAERLPPGDACRHLDLFGRHAGPDAEARDHAAAEKPRSRRSPSQYTNGLVTNGERYNKVVDIWGRTGDQVAKAMMEQLGHEEVSTATARRSSRSPSTPST
jgi:DNA-directed RNA polymerase subunit beta'